jgi:transcriptional regulator with XRE-family HTH domain
MTAVRMEARPWMAQGARIKKARKRTGLSQDNFAPRIGTTPRHLIRLENGEHRPGRVLLTAIARETGQTVDHFGYPSDEDEEEDSLRLALRNALPTPQADALYQELKLRLPTGVTA